MLMKRTFGLLINGCDWGGLEKRREMVVSYWWNEKFLYISIEGKEKAGVCVYMGMDYMIGRIDGRMVEIRYR